MRLYPFPIHTKDTIEIQKIIYQYQGENRWLSNFWPCRVTLPAENGLPAMQFDNVEVAYVAWKTTDQAMREQIRTMTPGAAKKLSHTDQFVYREPYTDEMRVQAMEMLVAQKFSTDNPELLEMLLETKGTILAEGNLHNDTFFGVDLRQGYGLNYLGRTQMKIRAMRQLEV